MADETYYKPSKSRPEMDETPKSEYPDNIVWQSPGGMRLVFGEERGKECCKFYHPSGSYFEFFPDGKVSSMIIGEFKQYLKGGMTITADENSDVHVSGHSKVTIGGGAHIEVQGDAGIVVAGTVALAGLKDMGLSVKGNLYLGTDGDLNMNVKGSMNQQVKGDLNIGTGGATNHQSTKINLNETDGASGYTTNA